MKHLSDALRERIEHVAGELRTLASELEEAGHEARLFYEEQDDDFHESMAGDAYSDWLDAIDSTRDDAECAADDLERLKGEPVYDR